MKNWLRKSVYNLCTACLALSFVIYIGKPSLVLFGEPEFPVED